MRYLKLISLAAVAFLMMGSGTSEMKLTGGIKRGYMAPEIEGISLKDNNYKLIQFWAAYDAESRAENVRMNREATRLNSSNLKMYSIAFDKLQSIFTETIKADKLDSLTQFNDFLGEKSRIYADYQLNKGFSNVLVNPEGVIIAKNIQPEELAALSAQF